MDYPHSIRKLKGVVQTKIAEDFKNIDGLVQIGAEKWILPEKYSEYAETIYNFKARSDDVYICTFPRSGTTWTQEMIWLICNNLDYDTAKKVPLTQRFPFLEYDFKLLTYSYFFFFTDKQSTFRIHLLFNERFVQQESGDMMDEAKAAEMAAIMSPIYEKLEAQTTPRLIKTHLSFNLMPRNIKEVGAKVVYIARNPKDVAASYYHFHKYAPTFGFTGDFELFLQYFRDDLGKFRYLTFDETIIPHCLFYSHIQPILAARFKWLEQTWRRECSFHVLRRPQVRYGKFAEETF